MDARKPPTPLPCERTGYVAPRWLWLVVCVSFGFWPLFLGWVIAEVALSFR